MISGPEQENSAVGYPIRDASGALVAVHRRVDQPAGKRMWWEQSDGRPGLGGLPLADLPLYGIDRVDGLATSVVVVEGEPTPAPRESADFTHGATCQDA